MNFNWKHSAGAFALSVAMLASTGGQMIAAAPVETGQLLIKDKPKPPSVEKGKPDTIKTAPPTAEKIETGQMLIRGKPIPPSVERGIKDKGVSGCGNCGLTGKEAAPPPVDDGEAPPSAEKFETGQMLIRGKPKPPSAERKKGPKVRDDSVSTRSSLVPVLGGVAALTALALAVGSGGDDNPTSP